jgi:hypothetical protein
MPRKFVVSLIICLSVRAFFIPVTGYSQENNPLPPYEPRYGDERPGRPKILDKLFVGGSLGLQFGSQTLIDVSPTIGYAPFKKLSLGIDPAYKYYRVRDYSNSISLTSNITGIGIFAQYDIFKNILGHVEYEYLHYSTKASTSTDKLKYDISSLFVGGGYRQPISNKASLYLLVLWNLNDTPDSPYTNPVFRAGVRIGL